MKNVGTGEEATPISKEASNGVLWDDSIAEEETILGKKLKIQKIDKSINNKQKKATDHWGQSVIDDLLPEYKERGCGRGGGCGGRGRGSEASVGTGEGSGEGSGGVRGEGIASGESTGSGESETFDLVSLLEDSQTLGGSDWIVSIWSYSCQQLSAFGYTHALWANSCLNCVVDVLVL